MQIIVANTKGEWIMKDAAGWNPLKRVHRWFKEKTFSDYGDAMENLRQVDEEIRHWVGNLSDSLKEAQSAEKTGRWLDIIYWLNDINKKLLFVNQKGQSIKDIRDDQVRQFFMRGDDALTDPNPIPSSSPTTVTAGLTDPFRKEWWVGKDNFLTFDYWAKRQLDNTYKKHLGDQRMAVKKLMMVTENTVKRVKSLLSTMEKYRDYGQIEDYLKALQRLSDLQTKFQEVFLSVFNAHFKEEVARLQTMKQPAKSLVEPPTKAPVDFNRHPKLINDDSFNMSETLPFESAPSGKTQPGMPIPEALTSEDISVELPESVESAESPESVETKNNHELEELKDRSPTEIKTPDIQTETLDAVEPKENQPDEPKENQPDEPKESQPDEPKESQPDVPELTEPSIKELIEPTVVGDAPAAPPVHAKKPAKKLVKKKKPTTAEVIQQLSKISDPQQLADAILVFSEAADASGQGEMSASLLTILQDLLED